MRKCRLRRVRTQLSPRASQEAPGPQCDACGGANLAATGVFLSPACTNGTPARFGCNHVIMLAADNWCVKVQGKVYGPYTFQQLRSFAEQGRLGERSLIAPAGGRDWREAIEEPRFAEIFERQGRYEARPGGRFGRRADAAPAAKEDDVADAIQSESAAGPRRARALGQRRSGLAANDQQAETANLLIVFDVVSGAAGRVETGVRSLGPAFQVAENVWSVACGLTATGVRNAIAPFLRPNETIFVTDTTNGGATWQNYAPEVHAKITTAYMRGRAGLRQSA